ncbi:prepilin-type N-terminal cleavage/methylation domain-containing protein, partial [Priestia flexa]
MMKKFLKNEKGLTLIELLAVIVILGIIAAIAIPSIGGIIQKSREDAV